MSTRSNIGILETDEKIVVIYCHSDGYPSWNGMLLLTHHNNEKAARDIVALGNLSCLNEKLNPDPNEPHSYEYVERQEGVTVAYGRDRGETGRKIESVKHRGVAKAINNMEEYLYLWDVSKGKWFVADGNSDLTELTTEITA